MSPKYFTLTMASAGFGMGLGMSGLMKREVAGPVPFLISLCFHISIGVTAAWDVLSGPLEILEWKRTDRLHSMRHCFSYRQEIAFSIRLTCVLMSRSRSPRQSISIVFHSALNARCVERSKLDGERNKRHPAVM